ncbi:MAG TPA: tetratricopeptide repeat protein [Bryobacteraceae bacterium]
MAAIVIARAVWSTIRRIYKLVLLVIAAFLLQAQTTPGLDDNQKLAQAASLTRQHHFAEAEALVKGIGIPPDPKRAVAFHRLRAAIAAGLQRPKESAEEMHAALNLAPNNAEILKAAAVADMVWLDVQLKTRPHPDLAATVADMRNLQAKGFEDTGDLEELLGEAYEALGDSVSAARSFQQAVRLSPNEERFRIALAIELMQHQTYEPALVILKRAAIGFPRSARTRTALALTLFLSGEEKQGTAQLLDAISLDPNFTPAIHYLGEIALNQGTAPDQRTVKAECDYAGAHAADSEAAAYCGALEARVATDNPEAADWTPILRRLSMAASRSPESALTRCEYGKALYQAHDWAKARSELQVCVRLDPNSIEGHYRLARVYERFGAQELARKELALRAAASERVAATNNAREESVRGFLYTMGQR